jgi:hypothetical protein
MLFKTFLASLFNIGLVQKKITELRLWLDKANVIAQDWSNRNRGAISGLIMTVTDKTETTSIGVKQRRNVTTKRKQDLANLNSLMNCFLFVLSDELSSTTPWAGRFCERLRCLAARKILV